MSTQGANDYEQPGGSNEGQVVYDNREESSRQQIDDHLKEQLREHLSHHVEEHIHQHLDEHLNGPTETEGQDLLMTTENNIYGEKDTEKYTYTYTNNLTNQGYSDPYQRNTLIDMNDMNKKSDEEGNVQKEEITHSTEKSKNAVRNNGHNNVLNGRKDGLEFPRQVMTAIGPLPLPEEFKNNIPEKFVAKPIIEEREIYVSKKERKQREVEIPHVQYEHTFKNVKKQLRVSKLVPTVSEVVKEIPKEILKPVIEEKIIEVPQGVKYVEVPVEVPCLYPPKIVPRVVTQYVERIVETIKPIVQEKIIEVPQTVIKQVPKIKTVEVPYYVPRYVEKIVEVPFKPNGEGMPQLASHVPFSVSDALPSLKPTHLLNKTSPFGTNPSYMQQQQQRKHMYTSQQFTDMSKYNMQHSNFIQNDMPSSTGTAVGTALKMQQPFMSEHSAHNVIDAQGKRQTQESLLFHSNSMNINEHQNSANDIYSQNVYQHNRSMHMSMPIPINGSITSNSFQAQTQVPYNNIENNSRKENLAEQIENLQKMHNLPDGMQWGYPDGVTKPLMSNSQMAPLVVTCPPEIGKVTCARKDIQPDILTKTGVYEFEGFKKKGTAQALFPPLAPHQSVPFLPSPATPGTPDVRTLDKSRPA